MKKLTTLRYYLEIISVPVFAFLIIHLGGHGLMLLKDPDHHHGSHENQLSHEGESAEEHALHEEESVNTHHDAHDDHGSLIDLILSAETLGGILLLLLFIWIWHRPMMKPLVPCAHDHCNHKTIWPHLFASFAFVFHFFPESSIRYELMKNFDFHHLLSLAEAIGFLSHFAVDVIIMVLLGLFWVEVWQRVLFYVIVISLWALSFYVGAQGGLHLEGLAQPLVLILSAFLLTMFIHKPHKPKPVCNSCTD